ncbi:MAG: ABC transporter ATP-binding protein [Candidatus Woykebacteria bacterium GWB1_45_5]|uniref:ABC transporter ATP-binding protein n=2 Tax=Candidatus Woykeibacteriota TaxID=1817899 RepID=A0A1G1W1D7_9BACT|nr:MAG: ABC transporter ATP-binding protein [Candidatus Woykebacteria bacterium GWA1_44_8]OGY22327.1 MAG: ABC transporter ATP-binding protein [Candidatus Woykebacteria bacterium GWB1_45_5]
MIELKDVTKTYKMGDELIYALNNVSLRISDGEFVALVGPSGSGKSTLANVIGGLDAPTAGEVIVDNESLRKASDKKLSAYRNKKVGFVFQTFNLQPYYTALENTMLPLLFAKGVKHKKEKAIECLRAVGLENRMKHKPNELSGGERQRVSIARALVNDPEIIIADEPTGNLDSAKSAEIVDLLKALNREKKITVVIITHDPNIARQAHRILTILDGKVGER